MSGIHFVGHPDSSLAAIGWEMICGSCGHCVNGGWCLGLECAHCGEGNMRRRSIRDTLGDEERRILDIYILANRHYSYIRDMELLAWPGSCTISAITLAPKLREIDDGKWRVMLGEGPSGGNHAWCQREDLAVCCTYGQFVAAARWAAGSPEELNLKPLLEMSIGDEMDVEIKGRVLDGQLLLSTNIKRNWFDIMREESED